MTTWTDEQTNLATEMLKTDAGDDAFIAALGRNRQAARDRVKRMKAKAKLLSEEANAIGCSRYVVPSTALEEAARRINAPRSLTATLMGDPPRGFSELDRRNAEARV